MLGYPGLEKRSKTIISSNLGSKNKHSQEVQKQELLSSQVYYEPQKNLGLLPVKIAQEKAGVEELGNGNFAPISSPLNRQEIKPDSEANAESSHSLSEMNSSIDALLHRGQNLEVIGEHTQWEKELLAEHPNAYFL